MALAEQYCRTQVAGQAETEGMKAPEEEEPEQQANAHLPPAQDLEVSP